MLNMDGELYHLKSMTLRPLHRFVFLSLDVLSNRLTLPFKPFFQVETVCTHERVVSSGYIVR